MATRKGFHVVPGRFNHWTLRSTLRYVGAQTREQRYQPAA
jgi:hypothetical protein